MLCASGGRIWTVQHQDAYWPVSHYPRLPLQLALCVLQWADLLPTAPQRPTMTTALILTVGGSHQPILASLRQHRPDRVYFLCSADQGKKFGSHVQVSGEGKVLKSDPSLPAPDLPCIA